MLYDVKEFKYANNSIRNLIIKGFALINKFNTACIIRKNSSTPAEVAFFRVLA